MDPRGAPQRIGKAHLADQLADLKRHRRSSPVRPRLPTPIGSEPNTAPANDRLRPDDSQGMASIRKQSMETDEYQPVEGIEAEPLGRGPPQDNELKYNGFTSTLYAAYSDIYEDGRLEIRNPGNEWGNVRRLLLPKSRAHRKVQLSPPILPTLPSHGENRGSSPLAACRT